METDIRSKIEKIANKYEGIALFHECDGHFGSVLRSVIEKCNSNIVTLNYTGGGV